VLERGAALRQRMQVRERSHGMLAHRHTARAEDMLRQVADLRAARQRDRSGIGLDLSAMMRRMSTSRRRSAP